MDSLLPQIAGKYEILQKLHEGGMGSIYKVQHRLLRESRVVKVMRHQLAGDAQFRDRFLQEARLAASLKHPNIARIHDFTFDEGDTGFMVMEFIDGVSLKEILRDYGPPDLPLALEVARQSLRALAFLHLKGYVHRDISPDNIMLAEDVDGKPLVKLIDLGIAKKMGGANSITTTGHFLGKLRYSSPEHFSEQGAAGTDERSDVYSFGLVLYELLTGRTAILGNDLPSLSAGHLHRPPMPFEESDPEGRVPEDLRILLLSSMAKDPTLRFPDAWKFGEELRPIQSRFPAPSSQAITTILEKVRIARAQASEDDQANSTQVRFDRHFGVSTTPGRRDESPNTSTRITEIRLVPPTPKAPGEAQASAEASAVPPEASAVPPSPDAPSDAVPPNPGTPTNTGSPLAAAPTTLVTPLKDLGVYQTLATGDLKTTSLDGEVSDKTTRLPTLDEIEAAGPPPVPPPPNFPIQGQEPQKAQDPQASQEPQTAKDDTTRRIPTLKATQELPPIPNPVPPKPETVVQQQQPTTHSIGHPPSFDSEDLSAHPPSFAEPTPTPPEPTIEAKKPPETPQKTPFTPENPFDYPLGASTPEPPLQSPAPPMAPLQPITSIPDMAPSPPVPPVKSAPLATDTSPSATVPGAATLDKAALGATVPKNNAPPVVPPPQLRKQAPSDSRLGPILDQVRRYPLVIAGVLVGLFLLAALLMFLPDKSTEESHPEVVEIVPADTLPPVDDIPPQEEPQEETAELHPEIVAAQDCLGRGDRVCAEEILATLESGSIFLTGQEQDALDDIRFEVDAQLANEEAINADQTDLGEQLVSGLEIGDVKKLNAALQAIHQLRQGEPEALTEFSQEIRQAEQINREWGKLWQAKRRDQHLQVIAQGQKLRELYPPYPNAARYRDEAADLLEADATQLEAEGNLAGAKAMLEGLLEALPNRDGVRAKIAAIETKTNQSAAVEATFAKAEKLLEQNQPEKGLQTLAQLGVSANSPHAERYQELKNRLAQRFAEMDRRAPVIQLLNETDLVYARKQTALVNLDIQDDYRVAKVQAWARPQQSGANFRPITIIHKGGTTYTLEIVLQEHKNAKKVEFYVKANDPSGHESLFGSSTQPRIIKRKGIF